jgi:hypothetical protein
MIGPRSGPMPHPAVSVLAPPPGVRIWLAAGVTDMRNYAESLVMRSSPAKQPSRGYRPRWASQTDPHNYDPPLLTAIAEDARVEFEHNTYKPFFVP